MESEERGKWERRWGKMKKDRNKVERNRVLRQVVEEKEGEGTGKWEGVGKGLTVTIRGQSFILGDKMLNKFKKKWVNELFTPTFCV